MNWHLEGLHVKALYMGSIPVSGKIDLSRVKYGGSISHHVELDKPITVYGAQRDRVIIDHHEILEVANNC